MNLSMLVTILALLLVLALGIWTLILVSRILRLLATPTPVPPTTPVPRGIISTSDLAALIGAPGAPGFPVSVPDPPDPNEECILALKLTPLTTPVTAPTSFEFVVTCFGAECQSGTRDCLLVWRRLGADPGTAYRPAGTHLTEAVDIPIVWACGCGLNAEDIPIDCKAVIQTTLSPTAPTAYPLIGLGIDCDTPRCRSGAACVLVQHTDPVTGVRHIWCQCT